MRDEIEDPLALELIGNDDGEQVRVRLTDSGLSFERGAKAPQQILA